jgi:hypothetical protein
MISDMHDKLFNGANLFIIIECLFTHKGENFSSNRKNTAKIDKTYRKCGELRAEYFRRKTNPIFSKEKIGGLRPISEGGSSPHQEPAPGKSRIHHAL